MGIFGLVNLKIVKKFILDSVRRKSMILCMRKELRDCSLHKQGNLLDCFSMPMRGEELIIYMVGSFHIAMYSSNIYKSVILNRI